jgi:alpha-1,2-mannosyltransferase
MTRFALIVLAVVLLALAWYSSTRPIDFLVYHRAATQILGGDYEIYPNELYDGSPRTDTHTFQYAPVVAWLFVPFGFLSLQAAAFVFACLKIAAYAYTGWMIARLLKVESRLLSLMLGSLVVVGGYFVEEFRNGNFHAFTLLFMMIAVDRAERGEVVAPAAALALAIVSKLTPLALLAYFVLRRRFAMCAATLAIVGILMLLPAAAVGFETNTRLVVGFARSAASMVDEPDNYSLRGALFRTLTRPAVVDPRYPPTNIGDMPAPLVSGIWIVCVIAIAGAMLAVLWRPPVDATGRLIEVSMVMTAMLIVAPHTQRIHFTTLFAPAAVLIGLLVHSAPTHRAGLARFALTTTAAAATFLPLVFGSRRLALAYQAFSPYTLSGVVLCVVLMVIAARDD